MFSGFWSWVLVIVLVVAVFQADKLPGFVNFIKKFTKEGLDAAKQGAKIVCILTGNGLKDPDNAIKYSNADVKKTSAELTDILKVMHI